MRCLEMADAFAVVLKRRRIELGLSQEALAEKADVHPTYIGLLERSLRNPSLNVSHALSSALGVPLSQMITEAEASAGKAISPRRRSGNP
jgi:transcriptional regulator with XRE-family HTH domain